MGNGIFRIRIIGGCVMYETIVLSGVSGVGKSFLIQQAIQEYDWLCQIPSVTTREKRTGIDESGSRIFLSENEFECETESGNLIFVNDVFGEKYGYRRNDIVCSINHGKTVLLDMKVDSIFEVKKIFPKTLCIYIKVQNQDIEKEIGNDRNNRCIRIREAEFEQRKIDEEGLQASGIDILFENSVDMESVYRFKKILAKLR